MQTSLQLCWKTLVTLLIALAISGIATAQATQKNQPANAGCARKLSDEQIQRMLIAKLPIPDDTGMNIRFHDCVYGVLMWPRGHSPDSNVFIELDNDGKLPPEVIKHGWHGDAHEDVSMRKAPAPPYPPRALAAKITGSVVVRATVTPNSLYGSDASGNPEGFISDMRVVLVSPPAAIALTDGLGDALRRWVFNPRMRYGTALPRDIMLRIRFSIDGKNAAGEEKIDVPEDVTSLGTLEING